MSSSSTFRALVTRAKKAPAALERLRWEDLPLASAVKKVPGDCDLTVSVRFSGLNYKDALVVAGRYPGLITPMVAGIDIVGEVLDCSNGYFQKGQNVVLNGFGLGTDHFGGYAEMARVRADWAQPLPEGLSPRDAARIGTAGYTAMLCVDSLQRHDIRPDSGPVLVTGATGGVGTIATVLLAQLGYSVVALTGKSGDPATEEWLQKLGASKTLARKDMEVEPKPLAKELYAGVVDTVGDKVLANSLSMTKFYGCVTAVGLAGGMALNTTVAPFILRGVTLAGVDTAYNPREFRQRIYSTFVPILLNSGKLDAIGGDARVLGLEEVPDMADKMLKGQTKGRYIVDLSK